MPTYIVGDIHITDTAAHQAHVPRATIARFGGRVVAGGGRVDVLAALLLSPLRPACPTPTTDG